MTALVFTVLADAVAYGAAVDTKLGYPKPGTDIGGGFHAPPAQSVTLRYGEARQHPTLQQWAYPDNPTQPGPFVAAKDQVPVPATATETALDATWFPAPAVAVAISDVGAEVKP